MNTDWKLVNALRDSRLWTASSLAAIGKEQDVITLEGRKRTVGEILDEANEALNVPDDAAPTSHPIPTGATGEDERQAFEAWADDNGFALDCDFFEVSGQYYDHDDTQLAYDIWRAARASVGAPAAGDALDKARLDWLEQHDGRFYNKDRISSIVGVGFLGAGDLTGMRHQSVRAAIDAAIAQQKGEA